MLVSIREAAEFLNVSDRHLRRMISRGAYPVYRIGDAVRVDVEEIKSASRKQGDSNGGEHAERGES